MSRLLVKCQKCPAAEGRAVCARATRTVLFSNLFVTTQMNLPVRAGSADVGVSDIHALASASMIVGF